LKHGKPQKKLWAKINNIIENTELKRDYSLRNQIDNSSGSVMDNIAEGFGRGGNVEFINFLTIAHGSACECQSQLYRVLEKKYINKEQFDETYSFAEEAKNKVLGLIRYLQKSSIKGPKFTGR